MRWLFLIAFIPFSCCADIIYLTNGRQIDGVIQNEVNGVVSIRLRQGTVHIPRRQISGIEHADSPVAEFQHRFAELQQRSNATVQDWLELATFAEANRMKSDAADAYVAALQLDPNNVKARTALGYKFHDNAWMTPREYARATGLIRQNNTWTTRAQVARIRDLNEQTQALNVSVDNANDEATALQDRAQAIEDVRRSHRLSPYTPYTREGTGYTRQSHWYTRQRPLYTQEEALNPDFRSIGPGSTILRNYEY